MKKHLAIASLLLLTFNLNSSYAREIPNSVGILESQFIESDLLQVTSDALEGSLVLKAVTDSNHNLQGLKYITNTHTTLMMTLEQLNHGFVLVEMDGYEVLKLVGHQLDAKTGGKLDLVYLSDAVFNSFKNFKMEINQTENQWSFATQHEDHNKTQFNTMFVKKKTLLSIPNGQIIGVDSITVH